MRYHDKIMRLHILFSNKNAISWSGKARPHHLSPKPSPEGLGFYIYIFGGGACLSSFFFKNRSICSFLTTNGSAKSLI